MKWIPAKIVKIVSVAEVRDRIAVELRKLGVSGFSIGSVDGMGFHGERRNDLFDTGNVEVTVVASAELAEKIMKWISAELDPNFPVVAWAADVTALPGRNFA